MAKDVAFLATLNFTSVVVEQDPVERARTLFMEKTDDQLQLLNDPDWKGHERQERVQDQDGNDIKDENGKYKKKKGYYLPKAWCEQVGNKWMITPRFGASKLKLSQKGDKIICDNREHAVKVLQGLQAATEKGELDDVLMTVMNKRRRK